MYELIRSLVAPAKPVDRSYAQLVEMVKDHHNPKPLLIVQWFKFNSRNRRQGERITTYLAELR